MRFELMGGSSDTASATGDREAQRSIKILGGDGGGRGDLEGHRGTASGNDAALRQNEAALAGYCYQVRQRCGRHGFILAAGGASPGFAVHFDGEAVDDRADLVRG